MSSTIALAVPAELSAANLKSCLAIIRGGRATDFKKAAVEFRGARWVAIAHCDAAIVGVAVIKAPRPNYTAGIVARSGVLLPSDALELGGVAIRRVFQGRGLAHRLVEALVGAIPDQPLFATTSNPRMAAALKRGRFVKQGVEWPTHRGAMSLWILPTP